MPRPLQVVTAGADYYLVFLTPFRGRKVKGQGHQAAERRDRKSPKYSEPEGLQTSNLVHRCNTMTRITSMRGDLQCLALGRSVSHHLQGRGYIVAAPLQATSC